MSEFQLIQRLQEIICLPSQQRGGACVIGIGDDAAVLDVPSDRQLVVCTDTLAEGVHFPRNTPPGAIGHKALAVNLSDLAAMGACPAWFFMALSMPDPNSAWLEDFAAGMARLSIRSDIYLAGGDTTRGALSICITALGLVEKGQALTRSGAQAGDLVLVSGRPGAAANALQMIRSGKKPGMADLQALEYPEPRLELGRALQGLATSCIDLSDGLLADLGHILEQSGLGAELELAALPCPDSMAGLPADVRWPLQLSGGDDYELCFTLPPAALRQLDQIAITGGVELSVIGKVTENTGLILRDPEGGVYDPGQSGYEHFTKDRGSR